MGFDRSAVHFLLSARDVDFSRTGTLGRQGLHISPDQLTGLLAEDAHRFYSNGAAFCEPLLEFLGASEVVSFDNSDYEGATVLHDFNQPLPSEHRERFTAFIEAGSLEHIFNFPQAIANCMEAIAVGGHFISVAPCNNFCGHGFYQISPELFYRVLSPENGFRVRSMMTVPAGGTDFRLVGDPAGQRQELQLNGPTYLAVLAQREVVRPIFAKWPQQSDYVAAWSQSK